MSTAEKCDHLSWHPETSPPFLDAHKWLKDVYLPVNQAPSQPAAYRICSGHRPWHRQRETLVRLSQTGEEHQPSSCFCSAADTIPFCSRTIPGEEGL